MRYWHYKSQQHCFSGNTYNNIDRSFSILVWKIRTRTLPNWIFLVLSCRHDESIWLLRNTFIVYYSCSKVTKQRIHDVQQSMFLSLSFCSWQSSSGMDVDERRALSPLASDHVISVNLVDIFYCTVRQLLTRRTSTVSSVKYQSIQNTFKNNKQDINKVTDDRWPNSQQETGTTVRTWNSHQPTNTYTSESIR